MLEEAEAPFAEIDLDRDRAAEALVLERSGGRRVVPTLRFDDRVWAFNPAPPLLRRLLARRPRAAPDRVRFRSRRIAGEPAGVPGAAAPPATARRRSSDSSRAKHLNPQDLNPKD